jgi:hypothetical protein
VADGLCQGEYVAQKIGAHQYMECSARTAEGVKELFEYATRLALLSPRKKRKGRLSTFFTKFAERSSSPRIEAAKASRTAADGAGTNDIDAFLHSPQK